MEQISEYFSKYISIMTALVTPIIGAIVAYIAYQQYRIRRYEVRMSMYDKRYAVFETVMEYLASVVEHGKADADKARLLLRSAAEAQFLFDEEIEKFIKDVYHHALEDNTLQWRFDKAQTPELRDPIIEKQNQVLDWFECELHHAKLLFDPYLKLGRF
ncbi:MAG: hypothetical protein KKG33_05140 [candidate division Zixibacteria bacterium]|nr:hypothetical protein [candidate division Zixibacteria bacterium]MBU1471226.1 hypothetical protein [candidate division Zixibacteria bacterium]MBU2624928.1 hypothetical protein [candidate division Zixibacteria bacterium]